MLHEHRLFCFYLLHVLCRQTAATTYEKQGLTPEYLASLTYNGRTSRTIHGWPSEAKVVMNYVQLCEQLKTYIFNVDGAKKLTADAYYLFCHDTCIKLRAIYAWMFNSLSGYYAHNDVTHKFPGGWSFEQFVGYRDTRYVSKLRGTGLDTDGDFITNSASKLCAKYTFLNERIVEGMFDNFRKCFWYMFFFPPIICLRVPDRRVEDKETPESGDFFNAEVMSTPKGIKPGQEVVYTIFPGLVTAGRCLLKAVVLTSTPANVVAFDVPQIPALPIVLRPPKVVVYTENEKPMYSLLPPRKIRNAIGGLFPEQIYMAPMQPHGRDVVIYARSNMGNRGNFHDAHGNNEAYTSIAKTVQTDWGNKYIVFLAIVTNGYECGTGIRVTEDLSKSATALLVWKNADTRVDFEFHDINYSRGDRPEYGSLNSARWGALHQFVYDKVSVK